MFLVFATLLACTTPAPPDDTGTDDTGADGGTTIGWEAPPGACSPVLALERTGATWRYDYAHEYEYWWGELTQVAAGEGDYEGEPAWLLEVSRVTEWQWGGRTEVDETRYLRCEADGWHLLGSQANYQSWGKSGAPHRGRTSTRYDEPPLVAPAALALGERWTVPYSGEHEVDGDVRRFDYEVDYAVEALEEVTVAAGTYVTMRVGITDPDGTWTESWAQEVGLVRGPELELLSYE